MNTNFGFGTGSTWTYIIGLFLLIVFFTYFYTAIQFDPAKQADSIQRQGGFIPGVRPGRQTEAHLPRDDEADRVAAHDAELRRVPHLGTRSGHRRLSTGGRLLTAAKGAKR